MKKLLFLLILSFLSNITFAQTFQKVFGDSIEDRGMYFFPTADNGFFLLSSAHHYQSPYYYNAIRVNDVGDSVSTTTLPGNPSSFGFCTNYTNGFITLSVFDSALSAVQYIDTLTINYFDTSGVLQTSWSYSDTLNLFDPKMIQTSDNGYLIAAGIWNDMFEAYILLLKLDDLGNVEWKNFVLPYSQSEEFPIDLLETADHYYLAEISQASGSNWTGSKVMMKIDPSGAVIWNTDLTYGYAGGNNQQIAVSDSGYLYIDNTNYSMSSVGVPRISLVDTGGTLKWSKLFYSMSAAYSNIIPKSTGGFYLCGRQTNFSTSTTDVVVISLNEVGDSLSSFSFGLDSAFEMPCYISELPDGRVAVAGVYSPASNTYSNHFDTYFAVADTLGNVNYISQAEKNDAHLLVYPNPGSGKFSVQNIDRAIKFIEIRNSTGDVVYSGHPNDAKVDINLKLNNGVYFVHAYDGVRDATRKLIIQQ